MSPVDVSSMSVRHISTVILSPSAVDAPYPSGVGISDYIYFAYLMRSSRPDFTSSLMSPHESFLSLFNAV